MKKNWMIILIFMVQDNRKQNQYTFWHYIILFGKFANSTNVFMPKHQAYTTHTHPIPSQPIIALYAKYASAQYLHIISLYIYGIRIIDIPFYISNDKPLTMVHVSHH